ncbi:G-protein coupled receptor [Anopheles sinensis]|uniref:G-protein coupled receptor n=1 Tax=Anopheles sinensis TaxID=74873 RepID=A0A084VXR6_ANOSI|nr:G-protein coupled receptor [Anopheles sinensis]
MLELLPGNGTSALENYTASLADLFATEQPVALLGNASLAIGAVYAASSQHLQQHPNTSSEVALATASGLHPAIHQLSSGLATLTTDLLGQSGSLVLAREECDQLNISYAFENGSALAVPGLSCYEHAPTLSRSGVIRVIVLSAMAIVSLLGNVATMWNIQKNRKSRRVTRHNWSAIYSLIFHLSIADVLVTGFCIIGEAAWYYTVDWVAGNLFCKLFKLCQMFSLYLSTYVLVLVGVDRWVAVKYPMKSLNTARRCHRFLFVAYLLSFVLSLPQVCKEGC